MITIRLNMEIKIDNSGMVECSISRNYHYNDVPETFFFSAKSKDVTTAMIRAVEQAGEFVYERSQGKI